MTNISDLNIFRNIRKGDEDAFTLLFDTYYVPLCFFANKFLGDMDLSRSQVQQVYVDLWEKRGKIDITWSVKFYMYHAVRNRSIDFIRKNKYTVQLIEDARDPQQTPFRDLVEEAELNAKINESIDKLPGKCREIFILCRFEGLKYSEIAKKLNISIKTVEMQMGIALKKLRKNINGSQMINLMTYISTKKK